MRATVTIILTAWMSLSCHQAVQRFPLANPLWEDPDRNHVPTRPSEYYSGLIGNAMDQSFLRPLSQLFTIPLSREARNVNALDEVPNSSWFTNRIGLHPISPERAAKAACAGVPPINPSDTWTVKAAKPDGVNPGFFIKSKTGTYLLKVDGEVQPQRPTAADVIGSKLYWAAGYFAPCNEVVYFRPNILKISPKAKATDNLGNKRPITQADVDKVLSKAFRLKNGLLRASVSRFLPGKPLGPFRYEGTRSDDPNDVVPHDQRRELRGGKLLAAWINHHDAREQNSLDLWVKEGGRQYVRHYYIDFGDSFGDRQADDNISRRTGYSYYVDYPQMLVDFVTLGFYPRPWHHNYVNKQAEIFGYYKTADFKASEWKPDYQHPAFDNATYRDELWMARIMARFTDEHIRQIVKTGKLTDKKAERYLIKTMIGRRDATLKEYFTQYAPLANFRLVRRKPPSKAQSLCFDDLAHKTKVVDYRNVLYKFRFYGGTRLDKQLGWLQFTPDPDHPGRSCVLLPIGETRPADLAGPSAKDDDPKRYGELRILIHQQPSIPPTSSMSVFLYDLGPDRGFRIAGIVRHKSPQIPTLY